jgi:integrase
MPKIVPELDAKAVASMTRPGRHACGSKLYRDNDGTFGTSHWTARIINGSGQPSWKRIGRVDINRLAVSLRDARQRVRELTGAVDAGEPIPAAPGKRLSGDIRVTFAKALETYLNDHGAGWSSVRYADYVEKTLTAWTKDIARRDVRELIADDVADCLRPHWRTKHTTAVRMREQIGRIFDLCEAKGWRPSTMANPARARVIANILGKVEVERKHFDALPWQAAPALWTKARERDCIEAKALRFALLTACRTGEVLSAKWSDIDLGARLWSATPPRGKKRKARVPLSGPAVDLLRSIPRDGDRVFGELGETAIYKFLRRGLKIKTTVHGSTRSTFADWASDNRLTSPEVIDAALGHVMRSKATRAYIRTDYLTERARLADTWAGYVTGDFG